MVRPQDSRLGIPVLHPQVNDGQLVLLAKQVAATLSTRQGGLVFDRFGAPCIVRAPVIANVPANSTDTVLIPAPAGKFAIRVLGFFASTKGTATECTFGSKLGDAATVPVSQEISNAPNGGAVLPPIDMGWFDCAPGAALVVTTGDGSQTGFLVRYTLIPANYVLDQHGQVVIGNDGEPVIEEEA